MRPAVLPNGGPRAVDLAWDQADATRFFASRLRPTRTAAAAPNSRTIGGAGTGAGGPPEEPVLPLELPEEEPDDDELDEELPDELPDDPVLPLPLLPVLLVLDDPFDEKPPVDDQPWLDEP